MNKSKGHDNLSVGMLTILNCYLGKIHNNWINKSIFNIFIFPYIHKCFMANKGHTEQMKPNTQKSQRIITKFHDWKLQKVSKVISLTQTPESLLVRCSPQKLP